MCFIDVGMLNRSMTKGDKTFALTHKIDERLEIAKDIPYINDNNRAHLLDIIYPLNSNGITIMNIHGGSYIHGYKEESNFFCSYFVKLGFTVISINYSLFQKDNDNFIKNQLSDVVSAVNYCYQNQCKLRLNMDNFNLMADSAGAHLAMLLVMLKISEEARNYYQLSDVKADIKSVVLNSPMYDYYSLYKRTHFFMNNKSKATIYSKNYKDKNYLIKNSVSNYLINGLKLPPIFISTSRNDFYQFQSKLLHRDLLKFGYEHTYYFDKLFGFKYGHVYNHFLLEDNNALKLNNAAADFIMNSCIKD